MHLHTPETALLTIALVFAVVAAPAFADFDRKKLIGNGEDYVVALHDSYQEAAKKLQDSKYPTLPKFFANRAKEIEQGAELFPAHPSDFPIANAEMKDRLEWAYEETYDVATSEAADMQPYLVAYAQIAYEQWLITMHYNSNDPDREELAEAFDRRLDALTKSQLTVSLDTPALVLAAN